jgi:hypothetical protein
MYSHQIRGTQNSENAVYITANTCNSKNIRQPAGKKGARLNANSMLIESFPYDAVRSVIVVQLCIPCAKYISCMISNIVCICE